ncbi:MAG: hypothetical protein M1834_007753 [Cirrosporium novae-zelandiae]|nr:MAG: hypothetical protein M1834_007753 [Cirrosporium novae-zelandiae]
MSWNGNQPAWDGGGAEPKWGGGGNNNDTWDSGAIKEPGDDFSASKHAGGDDNADEKSDDGNCRRCGEQGHFARECPKPRGIKCYNCGEEGHGKSECSKQRVFTGECRICNETGHPAKECPQRPPEICRNCGEEGHFAKDCENNRKRSDDSVPIMEPDAAWEMVKKADEEKELSDFKDAIKIYTKAVPETTWSQLEAAFRDNGFNTYLIAKTQEIGDTRVLVDLQGKLGCKYAVGFYYSPNPRRAAFKEAWPESPGVNIQRLEDAGLPEDRKVPKCGNCGEMGHTSRGCPEERTEVEHTVVKCVNCSELGHRARDCPEERKSKKQHLCRNCNQPGHKASDCTEPRSAEGVECKHCGEMGHFVKDCPKREPKTCRNCGQEGHMVKECTEPRNPANSKCRNCDEVGHFTRDCPKKKDWSRVKCNNCGEMGHTIKRCKKPVDAEDNQENTGSFDNVVEVEIPAAQGGWDSTAAQW